MPKRNNEKGRRPQGNKDKELRALYAKMRKQFTAADLQKYTRIEKGVPLVEVIAEMEVIQRKLEQQSG